MRFPVREEHEIGDGLLAASRFLLELADPVVLGIAQVFQARDEDLLLNVLFDANLAGIPVAGLIEDGDDGQITSLFANHLEQPLVGPCGQALAVHPVKIVVQHGEFSEDGIALHFLQGDVRDVHPVDQLRPRLPVVEGIERSFRRSAPNGVQATVGRDGVDDHDISPAGVLVTLPDSHLHTGFKVPIVLLAGAGQPHVDRLGKRLLGGLLHQHLREVVKAGARFLVRKSVRLLECVQRLTEVVIPEHEAPVVLRMGIGRELDVQYLESPDDEREVPRAEHRLEEGVEEVEKDGNARNPTILLPKLICFNRKARRRSINHDEAFLQIAFPDDEAIDEVLVPLAGHLFGLLESLEEVVGPDHEDFIHDPFPGVDLLRERSNHLAQGGVPFIRILQMGIEHLHSLAVTFASLV